jgi:hypothetical protein
MRSQDAVLLPISAHLHEHVLYNCEVLECGPFFPAGQVAPLGQVAPQSQQPTVSADKPLPPPQASLPLRHRQHPKDDEKMEEDE